MGGRADLSERGEYLSRRMLEASAKKRGYSAEEVVRMRQLFATGLIRVSELARAFQVGTEVAAGICRRSTWKHLSAEDEAADVRVRK